MRRFATLLLAALAAALAVAAPASADGLDVPAPADGVRIVQSKGRFVAIPGFPGERIDRRLLADVAWLVRKYHLRVTDGYSLSRVHQATGEHPRGLAVDLVPGAGGSWGDVARLARWAEPAPDRPRAPFKWVGWNGDRGHGDPSHCRTSRGCWPHLHLSWQHGETRRARPAPWVAVLAT